MIISNSKYIITIVSIVLISIITIFTIRRKNIVSFPSISIDKKIYVGYVKNIGGGISCEINYTKNKVSTLSSGYGITEEIPINNGLTLDSVFTCDFKEIVKNKSRVITFTKNTNKIDFDVTVEREGLEPAKSYFTPYRIHDIAYIYQTFLRKMEKSPNPIHKSSSNTIFVGYIGISEEDEKNLFFLDIDYQNANIYTITKESEPIQGTYSGDLNSIFKVKFENSFLGENNELELSRLDSDTYNARLLDTRLSFPMEMLNIIDISKLYSLLVFRGSLAVQMKKRIQRKYKLTGQIPTGRKIKYGYPKGGQRANAKKFLELYKIQKMAQLDFQNVSKSLEHSKKILEQKSQQEK